MNDRLDFEEFVIPKITPHGSAKTLVPGIIEKKRKIISLFHCLFVFLLERLKKKREKKKDPKKRKNANY